MECATNNSSKPSSNISELVSKFAKACKLRSIGVFYENQIHHSNHPQIPNKSNDLVSEDSSDIIEEIKCCDGEKVHPQPTEFPDKGNANAEVEILKLFDTISTLKFAYVQLQEAHIPYDPEKIIATNNRVVGELEKLCKIKKAYKERQFTKAELNYSHLDLLRVEIEVSERLLEKLKSGCRAKDSDIVCLQEQLHDLDLGNRKLIQRIRQKSLERKTQKILNEKSFKDLFKAASKSIHDFAKPLISLMKASGWDLDMAADSIQEAVVYSKRCHKKYAFEAYIVRRMFHGISLKSYNIDEVFAYDDPIDVLIANPKSRFAEFCREKYLFVVHPTMEASFFGNLDQRRFLLSGKHPRTPFYQVFAKMAKWIWVLQGIAASVDPNTKIFLVRRGSAFSTVYMESVEGIEEVSVLSREGEVTKKVEFMVMPGFRIGRTLLKAQVYLS
ncbi:DUF641 domain-containing protein [Cephalotus follicularis]|uniref:DUF641 domain-containing protein n=1 Tax=Cephalotus follicularis TaxID=3775 RepID=A0A1Q3AST3_CEPFO|nr:DUF641 domain-containing protein [Cephalotus follicularis]